MADNRQKIDAAGVVALSSPRSGAFCDQRHSAYRRLSVKGYEYFCIPTIDVWQELHRAVRVGDYGPVKHIHGNWLQDGDALSFSRCNRSLDSFERCRCVAAQRKRCERQYLFHANAPMAEMTVVLSK